MGNSNYVFDNNATLTASVYFQSLQPGQTFDEKNDQ